MSTPTPPGADCPDARPDAPAGAGSLSRTLRRGVVVSAGTFAVLQIIALVQLVVMARLLSPAELGLFAAGAVLTGFIASTAAEGLAVGLIQRDGADLDDAAETVFRASLASGLLLALGSLAAAPVIGAVFGSDAAALVAAAMSGVVLLHALTVVPDALMQRRFDFRRRMIVNPSVAVANAGTAIACAAAGMGVWSLVAANYAAQVVWVLTTWWLGGWRPGRGRASWRVWRELARFGMPLVVNGGAWRLREVMETVLVGRTLDADALGQFRNGRRLAMLPGTAIVEIASYVLLPAFARIAGEPERFRSAFRRALGAVWTAAAVLAAVLLALGEPVVVVVLGEPWRQAGLALAAMAGFGLGEALGAVCDEAVKGSGRSHLLHWTSAVSLVATAGLLVLLLPYGLLGVGLAVSGANLAMGLAAVLAAARATGVPALSLLSTLLPGALACGIAAGAVGALEHLVVRADTLPTAAGVAVLVGEVLLVVLVFAAALRVLAPATARELVGSARRFAGARG